MFCSSTILCGVIYYCYIPYYCITSVESNGVVQCDILRRSIRDSIEVCCRSIFYIKPTVFYSI